jgi:hypothetical protein
MNSIWRIPLPQLSPRSRSHLWNAALLLAAAAIALAADRLSAASAAGPAGAPPASPDVAPFVAPLARDSALPIFRQIVAIDPFDGHALRTARPTVASGAATPTVPTAPAARPRGGRQLTAILIADERRVAVIDESTVTVVDVLRDGARVSAIQPDRVWVVDKDGRWQMLTLTARGR